VNCYVQHIGVIDVSGRVHSVTLTRGLNVITGKSSTGKSAIIEIFDFCFASSDFTVPQGVITDHADIYFVVLSFPASKLVIARRANESTAFMKEDHAQLPDDTSYINSVYFDESFFIPMPDFKKELGRFFQLTMVDVDEDVSRRAEYGWRKSETPSVRSFTSFFLQHQNLIANKHAIFYRFDEKEKREQTIEHLRIFLGFADQEYFVLSQRISAARATLKKIEQQIPREADLRNRLVARLEEALLEYSALSGTLLVSASAAVIAQNPGQWLQTISNTRVQIDAASSQFMETYQRIDSERSKFVAELRGIELKRAAVRSSIVYAKAYTQQAQALNVLGSATVQVATCPFCQTPSTASEDEANELQQAIDWLNAELARSPYLRESFEANEQRLGGEADTTRNRINEVESRLRSLQRQLAELEKERPMIELAVRAKLRIEAILEEAVFKTGADLLAQQRNLLKDIADLESKRLAYGVESQLAGARAYIEKQMQVIGENFDFEASYRPINLRFDLSTFDLWHEKSDGHKVYLRSMGSGANWLYCHLTLFLALHSLFCNLDKQCKIPPILFIDQPSQVYFPNYVADREDKFDAKGLAKTSGRKNVDEDVEAVENLYSQLVAFCARTAKDTGLEPQLIMTDHADHLKLSEGVTFETFVRARWRTRGFIDPVQPPAVAS
jgi:hypothetical protein